tara:strand:+ start:1388 stop:1771 length:384 start_codon:yes stop_codon:yes gene_type:complete
MSFQTTALANPTASKLHKVTPTSGGGTAAEDELSTSSTTLHQVHIINTANASATAYVKIWNLAASNVTVGTTAPHKILPCPGGSTITYAFPQGTTLGTACCITAVTAGGTGGTASMTNAITVYVLEG